MSLMLHCGAEEVDYDALRQLETPPATATHVPIPHFRVVDMLRYTLGFYGHEITEEHHGVTKDAARYFGLLSLRSSYTGYEDTVALRNSHDKKFPIGVGFGSRVFVCDNLAFIADHVIKRKHTANAKRDLPGLIGDLVEPLTEQREQQHRMFERYKATRITDERADHAILDMYRNGGLIPRGPAGGNYTHVMVAAHSTPFIVGAYNKGIRGFDVEAAYQGCGYRRVKNPRIWSLHDIAVLAEEER